MSLIVDWLADTLLVNSISENFNEHFLSIEGHAALSKAVNIIRNVVSPVDNINFKRAKEGFIHIVKNLIL